MLLVVVVVCYKKKVAEKSLNSIRVTNLGRCEERVRKNKRTVSEFNEKIFSYFQTPFFLIFIALSLSKRLCALINNLYSFIVHIHTTIPNT